MSGPKLRLEDGRPGRFWVDDALIDAKLRSYSKLVYCTLARLVRGITIKISHADLAKLTDLSVSSVKRGLVELHKAGWLEIVASGGLKQENTYRLIGQPDRTMGQPELTLIGQPERSDRSARATTTEEATSEEAVEAKQEVNPAPSGAAEVPATHGLLLEDAVVVEAEAVEVPTGSSRPAGGTHVTAAAPARRGHPAVALYCEAWRARYGANPIINGKDAGTLTRLAKQIGADYQGYLARYFADDDHFLVKAAHSPALFETRLNALRVNGNGARPAGPAVGLSRAGQATMENGIEWLKQTGGGGARR